jgi:UDP-N-acetylmuramate dehydrogenase
MTESASSPGPGSGTGDAAGAKGDPDAAHRREALAALASLDVGTVHFDEPLRDHGNWRIGGPADLLVEPHDTTHILRLIESTRSAAVPLVVIGDGCNLLFGDAGVRGVVMKIGRRMSRLEIEGERIWAEAGAWIPGLARTVGSAGLTGIEHVVGIPSTLGGLIVMNGGSLRRSIGEVVEWVDVIERDGSRSRLPQGECGFRRRTSRFQGGGAIVVGVQMRCERGDRQEIRRSMLDILGDRRRKFPLKLPNCGSVFVSGGDIYHRFGPPGAVIEQAGLKGLRVGDAEVADRHANFIVNRGRASAADVLETIDRVRRTVFERTGIWMDCEVRFVAPNGEIRPAHEVLPMRDAVVSHQ